MTFSDFNFHESLQQGLDSIGFETPTQIQEAAIPRLLEGKDMIACAQTGTGKTAAFVLPIIEKILAKGEDRKGINALVVVPTRELAMQIDQQIEGLAYFTGVSSVAMYGGSGGEAFEREKYSLIRGADIVVATPGRLISHLNMKYIDFDSFEHFVLDEADRMMDMGFVDDILKIERALPRKKQTILFSATMPPKIREFCRKLLGDAPEEINFSVSKPAAGVLQAAYMAYDEQKIPLLQQLLKDRDIPSIIIFASTKSKVRAIETGLKRKGVDIRSIHSDLDQSEREAVLRGFKNTDFQTLVATDIVSRGIDIDTIGLVINYDVPREPADYVHRVGRTARAKRTGVALTFINEDDVQGFQRIEQLIEREVPKQFPPEELGEAPAYKVGKNRKKGGHKRFKKR